MKQNFKFMAMMLMGILLSINLWGEKASLSFTAACGGSGTDDQENSWTVTSDAAESNFDNTKGIHYGTSRAEVSHLTISTSAISGTISNVVVHASGASGTSATISVTIDGNTFGTANQSLTSSDAEYTFTGSATGAIAIQLSQTSAAKALYVKSIVVTYSSGASTPCAVTWTVEGNNYTTGTPTTKVTSGQKVTALPTPPTSSCDGVFAGWVKSDNAVVGQKPSNEYDTDPTPFTTASASPDITEDTEFVAVFKKEQ